MKMYIHVNYASSTKSRPRKERSTQRGVDARESAKEREKRLLRRRAIAEFLAAASTTESRSS